ncbi:phosphoenolpyruvate synthase [Klebsiella variicola]|nr:phosphoenolpyruvate synthase [Klebsiella variicola]
MRTVAQAKAVVEELERQGLKRGENGLKIIMMCEIPSNALLAEQFLEYFDGFSIGFERHDPAGARSGSRLRRGL